jgi:hypothetical protein
MSESALKIYLRTERDCAYTPFEGASTRHAMTQHPHRDLSFLEELELRQNEVLDQLADLERQVEGLLNEFVQTRGDSVVAEG